MWISSRRDARADDDGFVSTGNGHGSLRPARGEVGLARTVAISDLSRTAKKKAGTRVPPEMAAAIIVGVDGVARVLDFGLAKAAGRLQ